MPSRDRRKPVRAVLALVVVATAGFALGAYGVASGSAQGTTDTTGPETTTETITEATTTVVTEITTAPATTTEPATTTAPTTTEATTTEPTTSGESSSSSTPWLWIAIGCGVAALLLIGFLLWQRHRAGTAAWRSRASNFNRRCLVAMDDVLARGSVVTGQIEALAAEARSLVTSAPDDMARASVGDVHNRLEDLAQALNSDRTLRLGSPPPSAEQLSYSSSLIRQHVEQLQISLRQTGPVPPP
jgi:hypothetical protein